MRERCEGREDKRILQLLSCLVDVGAPSSAHLERHAIEVVLCRRVISSANVSCCCGENEIESARRKRKKRIVESFCLV